MQSLRGLGYSPETALADLVDNSIAAGATSIEIQIDWNEGLPEVAVLDNGHGLDQAGIAGAMCFGGGGPSAKRGPDDLGRFGLGLKTASLSQALRMTIASRVHGVGTALAWDVDEVISSGRWHADIPDRLPDSALSAHFEDLTSGTLIIWQRMDSNGGMFGLDRISFFKKIEDIRAHFAMVFHRFLGGDARRISLAVNGRPVRAWDPFQRRHSATITMQTEHLRLSDGSVAVTPYVLPHRDRFGNEAEYEEAGGFGGWSERQGFYVYRGKRLVVAGGWLGLGGARSWTREESSRLARISVDLPLTLDRDWQLDVRKSIARPPGSLRSRLTAIGAACRGRAREVFAWRGGRVRHPSAELSNPMWLAEHIAGKITYRIDRKHPALIALSASCGEKAGLLEAVLVLVERSVPVERIWLDVSEGEDVRPIAFNDSEVARIAPQLAKLLAELPGEETPRSRLDRLLEHLPAGQTALRTSVLELLEAS